MFSKEAQRQKIEVTDDEVRTEIYRILATHDIENPSEDLYERWLQATVREAPRTFESQLREFLRIQKLIQTVNTKKIDEPSDETLKKEYLRDHSMIELEMAKFASQIAAQEFSERVTNAKKWQQEKEKAEGLVKSTGNVSLDAIINIWQIPQQKAFELHQLEVGTITDPYPLGSQHVVFHIANKTIADEAKFESDFRDDYLNNWMNQNRYQRFITWTMALTKEADLKDYVPKSSAAAPPIPTPTIPPEQTTEAKESAPDTSLTSPNTPVEK